MQQNANGRVYFLYVYYCKNIFLNKEVIKTARSANQLKATSQEMDTLPVALRVWLTLTSTHLRTLIRLSPYEQYTFPVKGEHTVQIMIPYISLRQIKIMPGSLIFSANILVFFLSLTHCSPMSHFYTPWKRRKTYGFLMFSGGIAMWHWTKMG